MNAIISCYDYYNNHTILNTIDELETVLKNDSVYELVLHGDPNTVYDNFSDHTQIFEMLKTNESITWICFGLDPNNNYDYSKWIILLVDILKMNTTLSKFFLAKSVINSRECNYISILLKMNSTLNSIIIITLRVEQCMPITKAMKYNYFVTVFRLCCWGECEHKCKKVLKKYSDRNKHNIRLKALMIQDV
jgi:hypothetical protein